MTKNTEAQRIYLEGYEAFEQGDFGSAKALADSCLTLSSPTSYWYAGALGLKCWVASFTNDWADLEKTAATLLAMDTGTDKPWFDGVALLNLGLAKEKDGHVAESQMLLLRAAERYRAQELQPSQPREWQHVIEYFSTLCRWAATREPNEWRRILKQFRDDTGEQSELTRQVSAAAELMFRYAKGEEVRQGAVELVKGGVSRTFLSVLLLQQARWGGRQGGWAEGRLFFPRGIAGCLCADGCEESVSPPALDGS